MLAPGAPVAGPLAVLVLPASGGQPGVVELMAVHLPYAFLCSPSSTSESTSLPGDYATVFRKAGLSNAVK